MLFLLKYPSLSSYFELQNTTTLLRFGLTGSDVAGAALSTELFCCSLTCWMTHSISWPSHALVILNTGADDSIPWTARSTNPLCLTTRPFFLHYVVIFQHMKRDSGGILFLALIWILWVTVWGSCHMQNRHSRWLKDSQMPASIMCWVHIGQLQLWVDLATHLLHVTAQAEPNWGPVA